MTTVHDIYKFIDEKIAPFSDQCGWDNAGLQIGDAGAALHGALLALDVTPETVAQAADMGAQLLISHHPVIFSPRRQLLAGDPAYQLIRRGIACIAAHTNLDAAPGGVNDLLAERLGMADIKPLPTKEGPAPCVRVGALAPFSSGAALAKYVSEALAAPVRYLDAGKPVSRAAVCGGKGAVFLSEVIASGAQAYITGDAGHHDFLDARQAGMSLIAAGHYETEIPVIPALAERLRAAFPEVTFHVAKEYPVNFYMKRI
ncbi:MAG: Nif3-like dinuclear metal center hexameric protein [Oscillospiraceae bacterium]|nr:Nif3-like dinuclear metal center hexameric protein [Oscillospiraceae bacterium]